MKYLISISTRREAKAENKYPKFHYPWFFGKIDVFQYLFSKRANKIVKDKDSKTLSDLTKNDEIRNIFIWILKKKIKMEIMKNS